MAVIRKQGFSLPPCGVCLLCGCRWFILNKPLSQKRRAVRLAAFRPPRVVFVLGLVSLINSLTSGKKRSSLHNKVFAPRGRRPDLLKWVLPAGDPLFMSSIYPPAAPSHRWLLTSSICTVSRTRRAVSGIPHTCTAARLLTGLPS